jgi:PAS domain S-box-containing protein
MGKWKAAANYQRRAGLALALLSVLCACFAARRQHFSNQARVAARLTEDLQVIREQINERVRVFEYGLRGARGALIVAGSDSFTRHDFVKYSQSRDLHDEFPGSLGIGFVRRVPRSQEAEFVAAARTNGWPAFAVREFAPHDGERLIIQYIEPLAPNLPALGFDIASEAQRRSAAWSAARSGEAMLTAPIELPQVQQGPKIGQLMLLPMYRGDQVPATQAERDAQVFGWVYTPFSLHELLDTIRVSSEEVTLALRDSTDASRAPFNMYRPALHAAPHDLTSSIELRLYGRRWTVECAAQPLLLERLQLTTPWSVFALTLGGALLAGMALYVYLSFSARRSAFAARSETDALIVEGSADAMISVSVTGEIIGWNAGATRILGYAAHDLIGQPVAKLYASQHEAEVHAASPRDQVQHFETRWRTQEGRELVVSVTRSPIRDAVGQLTALLLSGRDVSEHHRLMQELEARVDERTSELRAAYDRLATLAIQLQTGLSVANVGGWEFDLPSGRVVWSEELFRTFAMDPAQGAPGYERQQNLFEPESWARLNSAVDRSIRTGEGYSIVLSAIRSDGTKITALARAQTQRGPSGEVERLVGIFQDISEQERAAAAMKRLSERLQLATSAAKIGVWEWNLLSDSWEWDQTMRELYGVERGAVVDVYKTWRDSLHPEDRVAAETLLQAAMSGKAEFRTMFRLRHPTGEIRHIRAEAAVFTDASGRPARMIGVNWDVTEQRLAEQALRRAGAMQHAVVTSAGSAIIATDPQGTITLFNRAAEELLGHSANELIGNSTPGIWHDPNEVQARRASVEVELSMQVPSPFDVFVIKSRVTHKPDAHEWTYIRKDGTRVPVQLTVSTLFDEDDNITGYLGVAFDLTQRKRQEEELVQLNQLLEQRTSQAESASHAKGMFLANMSHEFRTPIGAIRGTTYLLGRTALSGEQADLVNTIELSAKILLGMVDDVLDLSKIEAQQLELERAPFALQEVIDDLASLMSAYASGKPIELILDATPRLSQVLWGDRVRLMQVFTNLVANAIKFTDSGSVRVVIVAREEHAQLLRLRFEVHDTGPGMNAQLLAKLFTPFTQAEESGTRRYGGTGLGLAIVKQLVELMDGSVGVRSQVGVGSEFHCEIPFEKVVGRFHDLPLASKLHVLIVDDHDLQRAALATCARQLGWSVETVASGEEALARLFDTNGDQCPFDAVLMDWKMPGLDGLATLETLRKSQRDPKQLTVIMTTAYNLEEFRSHPLSHLADAALNKPVSTSTLLDTVTRIVSTRNPEREEPRPPLAAKLGAPRLAGLRVLIADDNEINRSITRRLLELEGAEVALAVDGQEAVMLVRESAAPFSVVLMDVQMPTVDGVDATRELRRESRFARLPILALTAGALASERERALAAGMNDFVTKPFEPEKLISMLRRYVPLVPPVLSQPAAASNNSAWSAAEGFDVSRARQTLADDFELFCDLILKLDLLLSEHSLQQEPADLTVLKPWAHKLAGAAGCLGADRLCQTAHAFDLALGTEDSSAAATSQADLLAEIARVRRGIAQIQASRHPRSVSAGLG